MSDTTNIRKIADSIITQSVFDGYSKVVVVVSDEQSYTAGNDTGRTLTVSSPWGTQDMANKLLAKIRGFQYHPYAAQGAMLDPAAEIGDGITAGKTYSGIYKKDVSLGPLYTADVSAPGGERINYQYKYKSPTDRQLERQGKETRASLRLLADRINLEVQERKAQGEKFEGQLSVQATLIAAKVSKTGGSNSSFGWELTDAMWRLIANNAEVLRATRDGLDITGIIRAKGGTIGGFDIRSDFLTYNNQTWGGTNSYGIYIGQSGIQCGHRDYGFRVTPDGRLYATEGYFRGSVSANRINYGGNDGYFDGGGLYDHTVSGGKVGYSTISTANTIGSINQSLANGDYAYGCCVGWNEFQNINCRSIVSHGDMTAKNFYLKGYKMDLKQVTINGTLIRYLGW